MLAAFSVLAIFSVIALTAMVRMNLWATQARLETAAGVLAQQKVNEALTTPWTIQKVWPITSATETGIFLNSETGAANSLHQDHLQISATRITIVQAVPTEPDTAPSRLLKVTGTVLYSYRGRSFKVPYATTRAIDAF